MVDNSSVAIYATTGAASMNPSLNE